MLSTILVILFITAAGLFALALLRAVLAGIGLPLLAAAAGLLVISRLLPQAAFMVFRSLRTRIDGLRQLSGRHTGRYSAGLISFCPTSRFSHHAYQVMVRLQFARFASGTVLRVDNETVRLRQLALYDLAAASSLVEDGRIPGKQSTVGQPTQEQPTQEQPTQEQPAQEQPAQEQPAQGQPAQGQLTRKERGLVEALTRLVPSGNIRYILAGQHRGEVYFMGSMGNADNSADQIADRLDQALETFLALIHELEQPLG
jgi:hypothetical protein